MRLWSEAYDSISIRKPVCPTSIGIAWLTVKWQKFSKGLEKIVPVMTEHGLLSARHALDVI
jgi:hypothetical protein